MSIKIEDRARAMSQPKAKIKPCVAHLHGRFLENLNEKETRKITKMPKEKRESNQICFPVMSDRELYARRATPPFTQ